MSAHSRDKGAAFEREVAKALLLRTGITFRRNLTQYQQGERDDLTPDDDAWPFSMELKRRADGVTCLAAWKEQATASAAVAGKHPCVVFRFDRQDTRCAVPLNALCPAWPADQWAEITLDGLCAIAADMMAQEWGMDGTWQSIGNVTGKLQARLAKQTADAKNEGGAGGATNAIRPLTITDLAEGGQDGC